MKRLRRTLPWLITITGIVAIAGAALIAWYHHAAAPTVDGTIRVPGLNAAVSISRDSLGVPSIRATSEHDLLFAQGYVHAQDRLWQMELMRHVGEGRLSEILGERGIDTDRFLHVFGVPRAAASQDSALDAASRARIQAYADGVNAYIREKHALPPEYLVLRIRPEPWTVRQTLAIEKVMALDLSQYFLAIDRTKASLTLDSAHTAALQPDYPSWGPTIVEASTPPAVPERAAALIAAGSITHASNAWVIGGARTKSGKPILANDMHLDLNAPPIWYLMALHIDAQGGEVAVAGMSLPGAPFIVAGHNRAIAWGLTNVMLDDADLFIERVDPSDTTHYLTPQGSAPFSYITDTLHVKGKHEPVLLRYRATRHGPVISDYDQALSKGPVLSLRWIGADPSTTMRALPAFMHASNWNEFAAAVRLFNDPHQNVVYADTAGHYGYLMAGRVPDRAGRRPPSLPVPGWTGEWDWRGYLPFDRHPRMFDPPQNYVVTANNRQTVDGIADLISDGWETPFRAQRIRDMILAARTPADAADVHRMQLDVQDASALRYRDRAIDAARAAGHPDVARALAAWDGAASRTSVPATTWYLFYQQLRSDLVRSLYGDSVGWIDRAIVDDVLEHRAITWMSDTTAQARRVAFDTIAVRAMRAAIDEAGNRRWGDAHRVAALHPLGSVAALQKLLHLNIGNESGDGAPTTVNVSQWKGFTVNGHDTQFSASVGPSQRHVADMADLDRAGGFILPGGESGLPFSTHYRDQWPRWLNGGLSAIPLDRATFAARSLHTLTLVPAQ